MLNKLADKYRRFNKEINDTLRGLDILYSLKQPDTPLKIKEASQRVQFLILECDRIIAQMDTLLQEMSNK